MEITIDLKTIQDLLEEQRLDLLRRITEQAQKNEPQAVGDSDRFALAQRYVSQQRRSNAFVRAARILEQVEVALQRLDEGT